MKRISLSLFAVILGIAITLKASAQNEQTRQVSGFNSISNSSSFNVHIKIDGTESLKITADKDIINDIETKVEDGNLKLGLKGSFLKHLNTGRVDVYITAKNLSRLSNSGSGSIKLDGELQGNAEVHISGSGNISAGVKSEKLTAHISGSGSISISGSSNEATYEISGSGQIKAKELKAGSASVHISGSGNIYITADKTITAHVSGSGSILYSGSASVTDIHMSGSGRIRKQND